MIIKIGSDELILWLRKNDFAIGIENKILGRRIHDFICSKNINGKLIKEDVPSYWTEDMSDASMVKLQIPITSAQYELDTNQLDKLYTELSSW